MTSSIIVAGYLRTAAADRDEYLAGCRQLIELARRAPGCLDFHLSADLLEDDRINIFEHWESVEAVERFRGSGPSGEQQLAILDAAVDQHVIAATTRL